MFERARTGDPVARDRLVERYMPLAKSLARRYEGGSEPLDDLIQVAYLGLVKAVDRFDPRNGARFTSFAVPTILGELKRHFRDRTWTVHVPRGLNELTLRVDRAVTELTRTLGRSPAVAELAEAVGATDEAVLEALDAGHARRVGSLDAPFTERDSDDLTVGDTIPSTLAVRDAQEAEARLMLEPLLDVLDTRDRAILELRFARDLTQQEIGGAVGLSQMQVSRVIRRSLARLHSIARAGDSA